MDYNNVATTIFSPLEYGLVGITEEEAIKKYTENKIEVNYRIVFYKLTLVCIQRTLLKIKSKDSVIEYIIIILYETSK